MWEIERHDWKALRGNVDTSRLPKQFRIVIESTIESEWLAALEYIENSASDLGVPSQAAPAIVACLISLCPKVEKKKRAAILSLLEELTCGRDAEHYTSDQKSWRRESVLELILGFAIWTDVLESGSVADAKSCIDILSYCAEQDSELAFRVRQYFDHCEVKFPELREEIRVVTSYFSQHLHEPARIV